MRVLISLILLSSVAYSQSLWLESGIAYTENLTLNEANQNFEPFLNLGLKVTFPVSDTLSLYAFPYWRNVQSSWQNSLAVDAGLWIDFAGRIQDLEGFNSFTGIGISYLTLFNTDPETTFTLPTSAYGLALSGGVSYDLTDNLAATLTYTHRPIFSPSLAQAFDLSFGFRFSFD